MPGVWVVRMKPHAFTEHEIKSLLNGDEVVQVTDEEGYPNWFCPVCKKKFIVFDHEIDLSPVLMCLHCDTKLKPLMAKLKKVERKKQTFLSGKEKQELINGYLFVWQIFGGD